MPDVKELFTHADLATASFEAACRQLGWAPHLVTLACPDTHIDVAHMIQALTRCELVLLPKQMLRDAFTWGVGAGGAWVWSHL